MLTVMFSKSSILLVAVAAVPCDVGKVGELEEVGRDGVRPTPVIKDTKERGSTTLVATVTRRHFH